MMRYCVLLSVALVTLMTTACTHTEVISEKELRDYIMDTDHGLIHQAKSEKNTFECLYWPSEFVIKRELSNSMIMNDSMSTVIEQNLRHVTYFMLRSYSERRSVDQTTPLEVKLSVDEENVPLLDQFTLPNNNGKSTATLYAFENDATAQKGDLLISVDDGIHETQFRFLKDDVKKVLVFKLIN